MSETVWLEHPSSSSNESSNSLSSSIFSISHKFVCKNQIRTNKNLLTPQLAQITEYLTSHRKLSRMFIFSSRRLIVCLERQKYCDKLEKSNDAAVFWTVRAVHQIRVLDARKKLPIDFSVDFFFNSMYLWIHWLCKIQIICFKFICESFTANRSLQHYFGVVWHCLI